MTMSQCLMLSRGVYVSIQATRRFEEVDIEYDVNNDEKALVRICPKN